MSHVTIATTRDPTNHAAFLVTIKDESHHDMAQIDALSASHARRVAADCILLIRKLDPKRPIVFDNCPTAPERQA
jgi:hypothetical protein